MAIMERLEWQRKASKAGVEKVPRSRFCQHACRPERAKALKIPPFCNISVKVLDLHQEIGAF